jgi:hypothetical protein
MCSGVGKTFPRITSFLDARVGIWMGPWCSDIVQLPDGRPQGANALVFEVALTPALLDRCPEVAALASMDTDPTQLTSAARASAMASGGPGDVFSMEPAALDEGARAGAGVGAGLGAGAGAGAGAAPGAVVVELPPVVAVMKVLLNCRERRDDDATPTSLSSPFHIERRFSAESKLPLRLAPHAGVVPVIHAFQGRTTAFRRFAGEPPISFQAAAPLLARRFVGRVLGCFQG